MMNQREAVFAAVVTVLGSEPTGKVELSKEQRKQVEAVVIQMFLSGQVELKGSRNADYIHKYVPGLVNNWLRKDKKLNGGVDYVAKNPGSRAGSGDQQLKAMKQLLSVTQDPTARAEIQGEIEKRTAEIRPKKEINWDALPSHLRHLAPPGAIKQ